MTVGERLDQLRIPRQLGVLMQLALERLSNQELAALNLAITCGGFPNDRHIYAKPLADLGVDIHRSDTKEIIEVMLPVVLRQRPAFGATESRGSHEAPGMANDEVPS